MISRQLKNSIEATRWVSRLVVLLLILACQDRAEAQYAPDYSGYGLGGADPGANGDYAAESFTLTSASIILSYQFSGYYNSNPATLPTDNFSVSIYTDIGGQLGTLVSNASFTETRTDSGYTAGHSQAGNALIENYTLTLDSPLQISAGTYYFKISNSDSPTSYWSWLASTTTTPPYQAIYVTAGATTPIVSVINTSLEINGTVATPEPSTWAMLVGGLGLLAFVRPRRPQIRSENQ